MARPWCLRWDPLRPLRSVRKASAQPQRSFSNSTATSPRATDSEVSVRDEPQLRAVGALPNGLEGEVPGSAKRDQAQWDETSAKAVSKSGSSTSLRLGMGRSALERSCLYFIPSPSSRGARCRPLLVKQVAGERLQPAASATASGPASSAVNGWPI